jgi:antitoxin component YwqK of YwqJK toxin-antitoxin module
MKTNLLLAIFVCALAISCNDFKARIIPTSKVVKNDSVVDSNAVRVLKEYFSNGKIKTETAAKGNLRHGLTKNYDREGHLLSQLNYENNVKEGMATNFYPVSGKINSTLNYKNGIKEGDEIWYYENGAPYRVTPYIKGFSNGIQKYYYDDGKLKAEVPWKNGKPGTGLREYKTDGTLITDYPQLVIRQKDYISQANKVIVTIEMSDSKTKATFYRGALLEGKFLNGKQLELAIQNGISQIDFNVPPGSTVNEKVILSANVKSPFGYPLIITKTFAVNAVNNY